MNEINVIAGLVAYLKTRALELGDPIVVIGLGDVIPESGPRLHVDDSQIEIVAAGLCYLDLDLLVTCPAKQEDGSADFSSACGFLRRALPPRGAAQRDALRTAILASTGNAITVNFFHHGESPPAAPRDPHRHQRTQSLRLGLNGASI